ncbi:MAG: hypothetical protein WC472_04760, partial [Candidatus Paceibacterota bacterium]
MNYTNKGIVFLITFFFLGNSIVLAATTAPTNLVCNYREVPAPENHVWDCSWNSTTYYHETIWARADEYWTSNGGVQGNSRTVGDPNDCRQFYFKVRACPSYGTNCSDYTTIYLNTCHSSCTNTSPGEQCYIKPATPVCGSTHYNCNVGTSINNLQGGASWAWQCQGSGGGTTVTCSETFPVSPVNGDCNNTCAYCCSSGYAVNHYNSGVYYQWNCSGLNGGSISGTCRYRPACTWSCGEWGACQSGNIQYRSCSQSPLGCDGENPYSTSQNCAYTPACTWSCGAWGACQSNNTQYRTCSSSPSGCVGNNPYPTTQNCVYSIAGACGSSNNSCTVGTLSDTTDTSTAYLWTCLGSNGGANASCS